MYPKRPYIRNWRQQRFADALDTNKQERDFRTANAASFQQHSIRQTTASVDENGGRGLIHDANIPHVGTIGVQKKAQFDQKAHLHKEIGNYNKLLSSLGCFTSHASPCCKYFLHAHNIRGRIRIRKNKSCSCCSRRVGTCKIYAKQKQMIRIIRIRKKHIQLGSGTGESPSGKVETNMKE